MSDFPEIEDVEFKEKPSTVEATIGEKKPPFKVICEKHGEINDAYIFNVNMPEHGFDKVSYCLVCAMEYLQMIATEVTFVPNEENKE